MVMSGAVCPASRGRGGASRALGASKCFGSAKTLPQEGFIPAEDVKGIGAPMEARFQGEGWRMPSAAVAARWLEGLEGVE